MRQVGSMSCSLFQSTPSGGKATVEQRFGAGAVDLVSIHAFRGEGDAARRLPLAPARCFNPRLPGGRRPSSGYDSRGDLWVSIHAFRGEGDISSRLRSALGTVSIHAFRGEGDLRITSLSASGTSVSIHAFRGEGDQRRRVRQQRNSSFNPRLPGGRRPARRHHNPQSRQFQSTPSGGKATISSRLRSALGTVSIHAFRGEGDAVSGRRLKPSAVSIHAFRGEGDLVARRRRLRQCVSIHAFRGEGDRNI